LAQKPIDNVKNFIVNLPSGAVLTYVMNSKPLVEGLLYNAYLGYNGEQIIYDQDLGSFSARFRYFQSFLKSHQ
jgi:hypothetical protein